MNRSPLFIFLMEHSILCFCHSQVWGVGDVTRPWKSLDEEVTNGCPFYIGITLAFLGQRTKLGRVGKELLNPFSLKVWSKGPQREASWPRAKKVRLVGGAFGGAITALLQNVSCK